MIPKSRLVTIWSATVLLADLGTNAEKTAVYLTVPQGKFARVVSLCVSANGATVPGASPFKVEAGVVSSTIGTAPSGGASITGTVNAGFTAPSATITGKYDTSGSAITNGVHAGSPVAYSQHPQAGPVFADLGADGIVVGNSANDEIFMVNINVPTTDAPTSLTITLATVEE